MIFTRIAQRDLVLSRKESQTIVIGDNIELTVVAIQGGRVKLGISAPKSVSIRRSELGPQFAPPLEVDAVTAPLSDVVLEIGTNQISFV